MQDQVPVLILRPDRHSFAIACDPPLNNTTPISRDVFLPDFLSLPRPPAPPQRHEFPHVSPVSFDPHGLANSSHRLRTLKYNPTDSETMASQHGLPHRLPNLPSLAPAAIEQQNIPDPLSSFASLSKNYQNMLASDSKEVNDTTPVSTKAQTEAPLDLDSMLEDILKDAPSAEAQLTNDDMSSYPSFANAFSAPQEQFLTSPLLGDFDPSSPLFASTGADFTSSSMFNSIDDFTSPLFTDAHDFGSSPLFTDNPHPSDNGVNFNDVPLFATEYGLPGLVNDSSPLLADSDNSSQLNTPPNAVGTHDAVIEDGPSLFPDFDEATFGMRSIHPSATQLTTAPASKQVQDIHEASPAPVVKPRRTQNRKVIATGTRRNLTPQALVSEDAPTQVRKYIAPSTTSRKDMPVTFARKRAAAAVVNDEDDFLPDLPPNATEKEQIEWKRRQNTIAARKSRKRKLEHQQGLEDEVEKLRRDRDVWKVRAMTLRGVLSSKGEDGGMEDWGTEEE